MAIFSFNTLKLHSIVSWPPLFSIGKSSLIFITVPCVMYLFFPLAALKIPLFILSVQHFDNDVFMYGSLCIAPAWYLLGFWICGLEFPSILENFPSLYFQVFLLPHSLFHFLLGFLTLSMYFRLWCPTDLRCSSWFSSLLPLCVSVWIVLFTSIHDHWYFPLLFSLLLTYGKNQF